jgi:AKAP7 2'5' RNA ligase-like domain
MYIAPDEADQGLTYLKGVVQQLFEKFQEKELLQPRYLKLSSEKWIDGWLPHATIAKTSADRKNGKKIKFNRELILKYESAFDGLKIPLKRIDLLEMAKMDDEGYYKSHAGIVFPAV